MTAATPPKTPSPKTPLLIKVRQLLKNHYSAPLKQVFQQFRLGLSLFFVGLVVIYAAYQTLQPSLQQEAITLAGTALVALGFLMAMLAQIRMLIIRIVSFINDK
jgi:hypothetical protein